MLAGGSRTDAKSGRKSLSPKSEEESSALGVVGLGSGTSACPLRSVVFQPSLHAFDALNPKS